jgi:hypothetical protein
MQIWDCIDGAQNQKWAGGGDYQFELTGGSKCIDLYGSDTTNGKQIEIWDCVTDDDDGPGSGSQYVHDCVDKVNALRATNGLSALTRMLNQEACTDGSAKYDFTHGAHADYERGNTCGGRSGQCECPNYPSTGPYSSIQFCMGQMWAEGLSVGLPFYAC